MQDGLIGTGNLAVKGVNAVAGYRALDERVSPDWSRNMFVYESPAQHGVGQFLGGTGVLILAGGLGGGRDSGVWCRGVASV